MLKYLELDSTYRNRQKWPLQSIFEANTLRNVLEHDPISDAAPITSWAGNTVTKVAIVVSGTSTTLTISASNLHYIENYYRNAPVTPLGLCIASYCYLGSNQAMLTFNEHFVPLTVGSSITIVDPTNLGLNQVFVPTARPISNYYVGQLLYDETIELYSLITSFNAAIGCVTVAAPIPGWAASDNFCIRTLPPLATDTVGVSSTPGLINVSTATEGSFIRLLPDYTASLLGEINRIVHVDNNSQLATVYPQFSTIITPGRRYELLPFTTIGYSQLSYSGSQHELGNSTVKLLSLLVPNKLLVVGYGATPRDYPYLYVRLTPGDTTTPNVNCSNNPHARFALFRATTTATDTNSLFTRYTGDGARAPVRFRVDSSFTFQVTLPNGQALIYHESDTLSPHRPDPLLQISASFEVFINLV